MGDKYAIQMSEEMGTKYIYIHRINEWRNGRKLYSAYEVRNRRNVQHIWMHTINIYICTYKYNEVPSSWEHIHYKRLTQIC